jgi:hypothetical protein
MMDADDAGRAFPFTRISLHTHVEEYWPGFGGFEGQAKFAYGGIPLQ